MRKRGILLNCDAAMQFIDQIDDPITKNFLNLAFVHVVQKTQLVKEEYPSADFDMLFFVTALKDFFAEHQVLSQTLAGEKVGAWFDGE